MEVIGIKTPIIKPGDDLVEIILESIDDGKKLEDEDILVVASSAVSSAKDRIREISEAEPGERAKKIAGESGLDEKFVEIILQEADRILAPSDKCILTIKDDMLRINAGADRTNVPKGKALLISEDPEGEADEIRRRIEEDTGKRVGVVISDSHVHPLRRGTTGQAIGTSGFKEVLDCRDRRDLYGRRLQITFRGIGDQLAAAAQLVMGESDESVPAALIRGAEAAFSDEPERKLKVSPEGCVYSTYFDYEDSETD